MHEEVTAARGRPEEAEVQGEAARPEEAEVQRETATAGKIAEIAGSYADEAVNKISRRDVDGLPTVNAGGRRSAVEMVERVIFFFFSSRKGGRNDDRQETITKDNSQEPGRT